MPPKEKRFVPFQLLSSSHPEYASRCAALKDDGDRCRSKLSASTVSMVDELHEALETGYGDGAPLNDDISREEMLTELATLTICGHQSKSQGTIQAAVNQWFAELPSMSSPPVCPQTPPKTPNTQASDIDESPQLKFRPYVYAQADKRIIKQLHLALNQEIVKDNGKGKRTCLYIFQCQDTKGMCKIGHTRNPARRASAHAQCYPLWKQHLGFHCPNAKLFEKVLQDELSQNRQMQKCSKCDRDHGEWFKADLNEISRRVQVWCDFSCGLQSPGKRSQVEVPAEGFSSDPDRWYKWAQGYVQTWDKEVSDLTSKTAGLSIAGRESLSRNGDTDSVPPLSFSSSAPGTPDDDEGGPPTPTPFGRPSPPLKP